MLWWSYVSTSRVAQGRMAHFPWYKNLLKWVHAWLVSLRVTHLAGRHSSVADTLLSPGEGVSTSRAGVPDVWQHPRRPLCQCCSVIFHCFFFFPETEQDSLLDEDVIQKCRKLVNTRSPSIQTFHGIKWKLFCKWYACLHRDPLHCPVLKVPNISAGIARQG